MHDNNMPSLHDRRGPIADSAQTAIALPQACRPGNGYQVHGSLRLARRTRWSLPLSFLLLGSISVAQPAVDTSGRKIAMEGLPGSAVAACSTCHGANGEGSSAFPYLRGTGQDYLMAQLNAFANGERRNVVMQPIAKGLSEPQRKAVSSYFSRIPPPARNRVTPTHDPKQAGEWLAHRGRWRDDLPACAQCHGPDGGGVGSGIPPLAGLPQAYIATQLEAWKSGSRPAGPLGLMERVAGKLSETDILAVSSYYAELAGDSAPALKPANGRAGK